VTITIQAAKLTNMIEFMQITVDPAVAARCEALPGMRVMVDLERIGKAERQAGRNTFISDHTLNDVARMRRILERTPLLVRINPLGAHSCEEIEHVVAHGADAIMLPMFRTSDDVERFCELVDARAHTVALLETREALRNLDEWVTHPALDEVYVGLNDLHISLGMRFMFEPLADGTLDRVAQATHRAGKRFGFGGVACAEDGYVPGRDILAEHVRLRSRSVILSRTFNESSRASSFEYEIEKLRAYEKNYLALTDDELTIEHHRVSAQIWQMVNQIR
jgi:hypothetical protein